MIIIRYRSYRLLYFLLLLGAHLNTFAQLQFTIESGAAIPGYNDVRVPNGSSETGTLFSLSEDFRSAPARGYLRLEASYLFGARHTIEGVAAPLNLRFKELQRASVNFAGSAFGPGETDGVYEFNTYRLSYRYRLVEGNNFLCDLGATILMRDARIALTQGAKMAEDTDLGFVPLISFQGVLWPKSSVQLWVKGDALVGPQGRAEDVFLGAKFNLSSKVAARAGYRIIEGGADVDQVYNFALIHFGSAGLIWSL